MDKLPDQMDSKFRFVLVAAARAEQLMRGARAKNEGPAKPTVEAVREVIREDIEWDYGPAPEDEVAEDEAAEEASASGEEEEE